MWQLMLQRLKGFKHEICLTTYEKIFERDLLRVFNARTPLATRRSQRKNQRCWPNNRRESADETNSALANQT
jgi:hypothetical protein